MLNYHCHQNKLFLKTLKTEKTKSEQIEMSIEELQKELCGWDVIQNPKYKDCNKRNMALN